MSKFPCNVCQKPTAIKCSRCKSCYYCDIKCQQKDYKSHRDICVFMYNNGDNKHIGEIINSISYDNPSKSTLTNICKSMTYEQIHNLMESNKNYQDSVKKFTAEIKSETIRDAFTSKLGYRQGDTLLSKCYCMRYKTIDDLLSLASGNLDVEFNVTPMTIDQMNSSFTGTNVMEKYGNDPSITLVCVSYGILMEKLDVNMQNLDIFYCFLGLRFR